MFLNLIAGLDRLGVRYRLNDFAHLSRHPGEVAGVIGKPPILDRIPREAPIVFGPAGYNHPLDAPTLFTDHHVIGVLVPCEWERQMFAVCWPDKVHVWPVGIDTDAWTPAAGAVKDIDVLVYNKIRFHPARDTAAVLEPVLETLRTSGRRIASLVYGGPDGAEVHKRIRVALGTRQLARVKDLANCSLTHYEYDASLEPSGGMALRKFNYVVPLEEAGTPVTANPDARVAPR